jgi:glycerate 2-kinase
VPCVVLAGQVSVGRREAAAVGVDAAYALDGPAGVSRAALVTLGERVARRWGR